MAKVTDRDSVSAGRARSLILLSFGLALLLAGARPPGAGALSSALPTDPEDVIEQLDDATKEALRLEKVIERAQEDTIALEQRIQVANLKILRQQGVLDEARRRSDAYQAAFEQRLVTMYKSGLMNPLVLLLSTRSISAFYSVSVLLGRVFTQDLQAFREAQDAAARAQTQSDALDDLKAQLLVLRSLLERRNQELEFSLAQQNLLVARLTTRSREILAAQQAAYRRTRKEWRESSIPVGTAIAFVPATVESLDGTYLVAEYQPRSYKVSGRAFSAVCSWYGNEFNGRPTASGQIFNQDDLTCASRTLSFGTRIALSRGDRRVIVVVNDRGPYIEGRDLDLSRAAARALGFSGVERVSATFVDPTGAAAASTGAP